ncbi:hypothetical protein J7I84_16530 [Arthrobacter sp. ISL-85]|uniref:hypothetical protein n=1 Tax=Arthrobacter sp. ISL-85 TaxID=2819115 RepID=UPI001BE9AC86|nr:hypothetical protein [Arthrobacter sp. ISL-85]MBT2568073.1 hypothetical protein [Arthrobacter sp. ISL-85]
MPTFLVLTTFALRRLHFTGRVELLWPGETYDHQLEALVFGLESGHPLATEDSDSLSNMALIDTIYRAAGVRGG